MSRRMPHKCLDKRWRREGSNGGNDASDSVIIMRDPHCNFVDSRDSRCAMLLHYSSDIFFYYFIIILLFYYFFIIIFFYYLRCIRDISLLIILSRHYISIDVKSIKSVLSNFQLEGSKIVLSPDTVYLRNFIFRVNTKS